ncbi:DUF6035 family protein [Photobacterium sp. J15]|uniref:DUF6035 family protein n=1 Tax=Photobacterium sp. J15 TaxID=265901 RepID=UPI0007E3340D|nr:hypothetical protein [Photobacterium sp. J15]
MSNHSDHNGWEILSSTHTRPILARRLIEQIKKGSDLTNGITRQEIAEDNNRYRCAHCLVPVHLAGGTHEGKGSQCLHFRHFTKSLEHKQKVEDCPFCHPDREQRKLYNEVFRGEGDWHLSHKEKVAEILSGDPRIDADSVAMQPYIFKRDHEINTHRKPDIYCCDKDGNHWVFELTRWWLNPETALARQRFYRQLGYNLVWLFSPDCQEKNRSTFHLLLYGANYREDLPPERLGQDGAQFNAFVLSEAAISQSESEGALNLEVVYPHFKVDETIGAIDITYQRQIMSMHSLSLSPKERLPFGVMTAVQLQQAKTHLDAAREILARQEEEEQRQQQASVLSSIRRDLSQLRRLLRRVPMNDVLVEQCRELLKQCSGDKLNVFPVPRTLRIRLVIARAESKVQAVVDSYLSEKAAKEVQQQELKEKARAFVKQIRGKSLDPKSEFSDQGRQLFRQLKLLELDEAASRLKSVCHNCHHCYIIEYTDSLQLALAHQQSDQWLSDSRKRVMSLIRYTKAFQEVELQSLLEKLLPAFDNHAAYLAYCRLAAELTKSELRPGLLDEILGMNDSLMIASLRQQANNLMTTMVRRYQAKGREDFAKFSVWDRNTDYDNTLPLLVQCSEGMPVAITTLLGCKDESLQYLPLLRNSYVGLAQEAATIFFDSICKALTDIFSKVSREGYSYDEDDCLAAKKVLEDFDLYASSFQTDAKEIDIKRLFYKRYGKQLDWLCKVFKSYEEIRTSSSFEPIT